MGIFVPLGIPDFKGGSTKGYIALKYTISGQPADKVELEVRRGGSSFFKIEVADTTKLTAGSHEYRWDGFDDNGILDTAFYVNSDLNLLSRIYVKGQVKFNTIKFNCSYEEVDWVDVRIDKTSKRIDVTLRVDLRDGGEKGTEKDCKEMGKSRNAPIVKVCPWDKIPDDKIKPSQPIIKTAKRFNELEKLALEGLNYHWGRNRNHFIAKNVEIKGELYEVFVNAVNTTENAMDDVSLIFNTNNKWMRSGNPGTVDGPISFVGNLISREAICYNVGYINHSYGWQFQSLSKENIAFKETSAHEIGHTILKAYGGTFYSYGHKGSVNTITQSENSNATNYPINGEIDLMKYFKNWIPYNQRNKMIATEDDVLSLIWLTKIELK